MTNISIIGFENTYKVIENLGYNHDRACYAKIVLMDNKEIVIIAKKASGPWDISKPIIQPGFKIRGQ